MSSERPTAQPLILFDGVCNLCNAAVGWVIARDRRGVFRFGSLQSTAGRAALAAAGHSGAAAGERRAHRRRRRSHTFRRGDSRRPRSRFPVVSGVARPPGASASARCRLRVGREEPLPVVRAP